MIRALLALIIAVDIAVTVILGVAQPYGGPDTLNAGWTVGPVGFETRGDVGPFVCTDQC